MECTLAENCWTVCNTFISLVPTHCLDLQLRLASLSIAAVNLITSVGCGADCLRYVRSCAFRSSGRTASNAESGYFDINALKRTWWVGRFVKFRQQGCDCLVLIQLTGWANETNQGIFHVSQHNYVIAMCWSSFVRLTIKSSFSPSSSLPTNLPSSFEQ